MGTTDADPDREMFVATLRRINRETEKFIAEHGKLAAETKTFDRERFTGWIAAIAALLAAFAAITNLLHGYGKI